ncbi:MAG: hypothetical protein PHW10_06015 [Candidatus Peribacteraceae bacterium]|nr:hypothetical protein [Candidatus Peribacteraceae bacterium]
MNVHENPAFRLTALHEGSFTTVNVTAGMFDRAVRQLLTEHPGAVIRLAVRRQNAADAPYEPTDHFDPTIEGIRKKMIKETAAEEAT